MRPNTERNDTDLVYSFYKTLTVVDESENNATVLERNDAPKASNAI